MTTPFISFAQINQEINYQGKLTDTSGVAVADGTYNMNFWLVASSTAATSTAVWSEARTGGNQVQVTNGLFSVMLGEVSSLSGVDFNQTLYLGVEIGGTSTPSWDGEMSPRKVIGAVPAAFVAENANTFDGYATTSFLRADAEDTMEATSSSALLSLVQNGSGSVLDLFTGTSSVLTVLNNGNVGIGTTSPSAKLSVAGTDVEVNIGGYFGSGYGAISLNGTTGVNTYNFLSGNSATDNSLYINRPTGGDINFKENNGTSQMIISASGNVGVGTTTTASSKLTVDGGVFVDGSLTITDALKDSQNASGTTGQILSSTGTSTLWTSISGLGLGDGTFLGLSDTISSYTANRLFFTNSGGTAVTDSADLVFDGTNFGIGIAAPTSRLTVDYDTSSSTGTHRNTEIITTFNPSTASYNSTVYGLDIKVEQNATADSQTGASGEVGFARGLLSRVYVNSDNEQNDIYGATTGVEYDVGSSASTTHAYGSHGMIFNQSNAGAHIQNAWVDFSEFYQPLNGTASTVISYYSDAGLLGGYVDNLFSYKNKDLSSYITSGTLGNQYGAVLFGNSRLGNDFALPTHTLEVVGDLSMESESGSSSIRFRGNKAFEDREDGFLRYDPDGSFASGLWFANNALKIGSGYISLGGFGGTHDGSIEIDGSTGRIGIGTSTPSSELSVVGDTYLNGDLTLTGALTDASNATGTSDQILSSTGTSTLWTSASGLGLGDGTFLGLSDTISSYTANRVIFTNSGGTALDDSANFTFDDTNLNLLGTTGVLFGGDTKLSRGSANRLDLATGDSLNIVSGSLQFAGTDVITSGRLAQMATGTESAPAFTFSSDTNTGIFSSLTDTLSFTTGGAERVSIGSGGNVGIGTTTPSSKLTVVGGTYLNGSLTLTGAFKDSTSATGTLGMILQTTGTSTQWVATSSLGIGGGSSTFTDLSDVSISSLAANRVIFTNSGGTALDDSANFTFDGTDLGLGAQSSIAFGGTNYLYASSTNDSVIFGENAGATFSNINTHNVAIGYEAARYASTSNSINNNFIGYQAGYNNSGAEGSNIIGWQAGYNNTGNDNNLIGPLAGKNNTGSYNNLLGLSAGFSNTGSSSNLLGSSAGYNNSGDNVNIFGEDAGNTNTGDHNNIFGQDAGYFNNGNENNLFGLGAGGDNDGSYNNFFGSYAGQNNTGNYNEMIGYQTGSYMQSTSSVLVGSESFYGVGETIFQAVNNTALGYRAGYNAATGADNNILLGYQAADNLTSGANNIVIGYDVDLTSATGDNQLNIGNLIFGTGIDGTGTTLSSGNIGIGTVSPATRLDITNSATSSAAITLRDVVGNISMEFRAGTSTLYNTFIGVSTGINNGSGSTNTGVGYNALFTNTTGSSNTANGYQALFNNTTGGQNTAGGYQAMAQNQDGSFNTAYGLGALYGNTSGNNNSAFGWAALYTNTTGVDNTAVGINAGRYIADGAGSNATSSDSLYLGFNTRALFSGASNEIVIGANAIGNGSNSVTLGSTTVTKTILQGNVGVGTTTPEGRLSLEKLNLDGAGVAGIDQYFSSVNNTGSAIQYGNRSYINANNTATTTLIGSMTRIKDGTTFGNTVVGLEVQADLGSNTLGENTALSGFGRTFGVKGFTSGDAGGEYEPAGVFGETTGTTQGNAIRGYSSSITTAALLKLFQDTSAFTGTGLLMNFGNTTGSFSSTTASKFVDLQNAGTSMFTVGAYGMLTVGASSTSNNAGIQIGYGGLCVDNDGSCSASTTGRISSVSSHTGNSDLAEMYFSNENLEPGEVVYLKGGLSVGRADEETKDRVIGVVSTKPGLLLGFDDESLKTGEEGYPLALSGRVPVKLSNENGPIKKGDELMLSSIPGVAMKATSTGKVIGVALEDFVENRAYSDTYINQFGDDIATPVFTPIENNDPRINDGCYYGGGGRSGDESCVPLKATTTDAQIKEAEVLAEAEALEELTKERSDRVTLDDGREVRVGQVVMFVDMSYRYLDDDGKAMVTALLANASSTEEGLENENETIWQRLVTLANNFVDGVLSIFTLKADRVEVKDELCVDGVCLNADDLRYLLEEKERPKPEPSAVPSPTDNDSEEETEEDKETETETEPQSESDEGESEIIEESEELGSEESEEEIIDESPTEEESNGEEVEEEGIEVDVGSSTDETEEINDENDELQSTDLEETREEDIVEEIIEEENTENEDMILEEDSQSEELESEESEEEVTDESPAEEEANDEEGEETAVEETNI